MRRKEYLLASIAVETSLGHCLMAVIKSERDSSMSKETHVFGRGDRSASCTVGEKAA